MKNNERRLKIIFNKAGSGSISSKLALPKDWVNKMGLSPENRQVVAVFNADENYILIKPEKNIENNK